MQSYVQTIDKGQAGPGLLDRIVRNASVAGLGGVALSALVTLLPEVHATSGTQWICAGVGALVGVALAFIPDRSRVAIR
jgi:hypothetical protein